MKEEKFGFPVSHFAREIVLNGSTKWEGRTTTINNTIVSACYRGEIRGNGQGGMQLVVEVSCDPVGDLPGALIVQRILQLPDGVGKEVYAERDSQWIKLWLRDVRPGLE